MGSGRADGEDEVQGYAGLGLVGNDLCVAAGGDSADLHRGGSSGGPLGSGLAFFALDSRLTLGALLPLGSGRADGEDEVQGYAGLGLVGNDLCVAAGGDSADLHRGGSSGEPLGSGLAFFAPGPLLSLWPLLTLGARTAGITLWALGAAFTSGALLPYGPLLPSRAAFARIAFVSLRAGRPSRADISFRPDRAAITLRPHGARISPRALGADSTGVTLRPHIASYSLRPSRPLKPHHSPWPYGTRTAHLAFFPSDSLRAALTPRPLRPLGPRCALRSWNQSLLSQYRCIAGLIPITTHGIDLHTKRIPVVSLPWKLTYVLRRPKAHLNAINCGAWLVQFSTQESSLARPLHPMRSICTLIIPYG